MCVYYHSCINRGSGPRPGGSPPAARGPGSAPAAAGRSRGASNDEHTDNDNDDNTPIQMIIIRSRLSRSPEIPAGRSRGASFWLSIV